MNFSEFKLNKVIEETANTDLLTSREKHLIGLAVTTTRGCIKCTEGRITKAIKSDISYETLLAAIDLAGAVNAGVTLAIAIQGANAARINAKGE
ncbi:MAG: carboxymuconolactone decarboxylase family protein [Oligoflexales bacterium]